MNPTIEQWKALYEEAISFKQSKCWEWMTNAHMFGVQNPESGEVGYCSILGNGGEVFGLSVYMGTKGLNSIMRMFSGESDEDPRFAQDALLLSFDNRDELYPRELKQIKELGLKFRGAHAWPTLRVYEPGFVPWPVLTQEQAVFFTWALRQAREIALEFRHDPDALFHEDEETFLVRVPSRTEGGIVWTNQWLQPEPLEEMPTLQADPVDELRLTKAKKSAKGSAGIWEIDCFFAPIPVDEGERPFYPKMFLIVDQSSGQILKHGLSEKTQIANDLVDGFLALVEQLKFVPGEIWATNEEVYVYLRQVLQAFEPQAYLTDELPALEDAKDSMLHYFGAGMR